MQICRWNKKEETPMPKYTVYKCHYKNRCQTTDLVRDVVCYGFVLLLLNYKTYCTYYPQIVFHIYIYNLISNINYSSLASHKTFHFVISIIRDFRKLKKIKQTIISLFPGYCSAYIPETNLKSTVKWNSLPPESYPTLRYGHFY